MRVHQRESTLTLRKSGVIFVGDDWAEAHHDMCIIDETGKVLAKRRGPEGLGVRKMRLPLEPYGPSDI
ncbi:MAG: hypothetical protein NVSMB32_01160 [Actinomycetota bacterium]